MGAETKCLRDLPGIMEIEALCKSPSYFDDFNIRDTMWKIDQVSIALFSLSYYDTAYDEFEWAEDEEAPTREQWETLMSNTMKPYSVARPFWEAAGWDITDGNGQELQCAHYYTKQIIIAEFANVEGIELTPDGTGREQDDEQELPEDELAERLDREAKAFLLRRNG